MKSFYITRLAHFTLLVLLTCFCIPGSAAINNRVIPGNSPDPHVLRDVLSDGRVIYYLIYTTSNEGDFPVYQSFDLAKWILATPGLFGKPSIQGHSLEVNGKWLKNETIWMVFTSRKIAYLLMEKGSHIMADGVRIQAGKQWVNHRWSHVGFTPRFFVRTPVVFSQAQILTHRQ